MIIKNIAILISLAICFCASAQKTATDGQFGALTAPTNLPLQKSVNFWATDYFLHKAQPLAKGGVKLLDQNNHVLGPSLKKKDWCYGAMEGTVMVSGVTFNYSGKRKTKYVDCSSWFSGADSQRIGYSRFALAKGPFGDGVDGFILVPYRTIATDPIVLPTGTAIFIPEAVGHLLPGGKKHDGYFFVGDKGGLIKGAHLDVFNGLRSTNFKFVRSKPKPLFKAYIVDDPKIIDKLRRMHLP